MAPRVENQNQCKLYDPLKPFELFPQPQQQPPVIPQKPQIPADKPLSYGVYGDQQRDRLERLLGAGAAYSSNNLYGFRGKAFQDASLAYHRVMQEGLKNFSANPDLAQLTRQARAEYENVLKSRGISPQEAPNFSIVNQLNMLDAESSRTGGFYTLDSKTMQTLVASEQNPKVFVRMLWTGERNAKSNFRLAIDNPDAHLAFFDPVSRQGKTIAWSTTPEDLMGSRLDYQEVMRRIGWTEPQIAGADPAQYKLVVFTEEAAVNLRLPTNENIITTARTDDQNFKPFPKTDNDFWQKVLQFDYESSLQDAQRLGFDRDNYKTYTKTLPPDQASIANARYQMEYSMGVNPLFSGDALTKRPDLINNRVGGREFITDNLTDGASLFEMSKKGQIAFVDLQDHNVTAKTPIALTETPITAPTFTSRQMLISETRTGGIMGGAFSAATSLYQIFGEGQEMDAATFAGYTALGTGVGSFSAAGEQIIGNRIASSLSRSNLMDRGLSSLYNNGAARTFISRFGGTEASSITSATFKSTARTIAGRIGGAGIVGGIVNGAFSAYDQIGAYNRGEVTASQAIGTVTGEAAVGVGAGLAGAAAGAAIGSIIPGAGTIVGGVIGFGVGMVAGYLADKGLRGLGVNTMIADGVTSLIDGGAEVVNTVSNAVNDAGEAIGNFADDVGGAISGGLRSIFG